MRVRWLRRALVDLDSAEAWIMRENPAAAETVLRIVRAVSLLQDHPALGRPGRVPGTRELVVPETKFLVPYRVREGVIEILRVYHAARRWPDQFGPS